MEHTTTGGNHPHTELPIICECEFPVMDALTFRCRRCTGLVPYRVRMRLIEEYENTMGRFVRSLAFTIAALGGGLLVAQLVRFLLGK